LIRDRSDQTARVDAWWKGFSEKEQGSEIDIERIGVFDKIARTVIETDFTDGSSTRGLSTDL
jgi:hypothetical protein